MTLNVLQNKSQISESRKELVDMGAPALDSGFVSWAKKFHLIPGVEVGDMVKSWDVLQTTKFLNSNVAMTDSILDIGCYASEITSILYKLGYTNLVGADLNPKLHKMPYGDHIKYEVADFMHTPFADASFTAVTSISVIEHGFNPRPLLAEVTRLLKQGGFFIASFDYWPDKIDTANVRFFNMDWKIFSKDEVADFIEMAAGYGLIPVGNLVFEALERPIECGGRAYTFGWLVLKKR